MKKYIYYLLLFLPLCSNAQTGIKFTKEPDWEAVVKKAQQEKKKIFVDVYATWCIPCKKMDEEVYVNDGVAKVFESLYISLKLQVDTNAKDDGYIKSWRKTAKQFSEKYNVTSLPSYLFFDTNGLILHKAEGSKTPQQFKELGLLVNNPDNGYYTKIRNFRSGLLSKDALQKLAFEAKKHRDITLANELAKDFYVNYVITTPNSFYDHNNLNFIKAFPDVVNFNDEVFKTLLKQSSATDSIGIAADQMMNIIIDAKLWVPIANAAKRKNVLPDWKSLSKKVTKTTNPTFADEYLLDRKIAFLKVIKKEADAVPVILEKWKKYDIDTANLLKTYNELTLVCNYGKSIAHLKEALKWMEVFASFHKEDKFYDGIIDTYVGLLYRSGKTEEAIKMQSEFLKTIADKNYKNAQLEVLNKMKQGKPLGIIK